MSEIPEALLPAGWSVRRLGEVAGIVQGQSPPSSECNTEGDGFPFFQGKAEFGQLYPVPAKWCPTPRKRAQPEDILLSVRAPVGPTNVAREICGIGRGLAAIRASEAVEQRYLLHYLRASAPLLRAHATGSTFEAIGGKQVRDHPVVLAPVSQQRAISEQLDTQLSRLDAATATLERAQRNLKRYRASVLKAAVEGRLVPTEAALARAEGRSYEPASVLLDRILAERRARWEASGKKGNYEEPVAPDTAGLPELPEGWRWGSLPQIGELGRGKSKHRPRNDPRLLGGPHPFIQTGDVRKSGGRITRYSSTYSDFGLAQSRMWPAGTICITIAANIAETGILGFDACFPDSVVGLLVTGPSEVAEFVEYFIRTAREELSRYAPATAQKNINLEILEKVVVPLPPLAEIGRIVDEISRRLTVADAAETSVVADLTRLERLRGSVLRAAFRGELG